MKKYLAVFLIIVIMSSNLGIYAFAAGVDSEYKVSSWAEESVDRAIKEGLVPQELISEDLTKPVLGEELAAVAVLLYEKMTGKTLEPGKTPFSDIEDSKYKTEIEKMYNAGLCWYGDGTTYVPNKTFARSGVAETFCKVFKAYAFKDWTLEKDAEFKLYYYDAVPYDESIPENRCESVYFLRKYGVVNGIGNNKFFVDDFTGYSVSREQVIVIALNMLEKMSDLSRINYEAPTIAEENKVDMTNQKITIKNFNDIHKSLNCKNITCIEIVTDSELDFSPLKDIEVEWFRILKSPGTFDARNINSKVEQLEIYNTELKNIENFKNFSNLWIFTWIDYYGRRMPDFEFLKDCSEVSTLVLSNGINTNLDFIKNMKNLRTLKIDNSKITDLSALRNVNSKLNFLEITNCNLSDISPIADLESLVVLDLSGNNITDVSAIADSKSKILDFVELDNNYIKDISCLSKIDSLTQISACNNMIEDFPEELLKDDLYLLNLGGNNIEQLTEEEISKFNMYDKTIRINLHDNLLDRETYDSLNNEKAILDFYENGIDYDISMEDSIRYTEKIKEIIAEKEPGNDVHNAELAFRYAVNNQAIDTTMSAPGKDTAYGALFDTAVCTGYTRLFNSLCRHMGIKTKEYIGDNDVIFDEYGHMWSLACVDGVWYHFDPMLSYSDKEIGEKMLYAFRTDREMKENEYFLFMPGAPECNTEYDKDAIDRIVE